VALRTVVGIVHGVRAVRGSAEPVLDTVLAARHLAQAVLVERSGSADAHTLSGVVDVLHGASMVPVAVADRRRRGFAAGQVVTALVLTIAEWTAVGTGSGAVGGRR
jgi:hypothetical protein